MSPTIFDVVAIGASMGGLRALGQLLSKLPSALPIPILVVQHRPPGYVNYAPELLRRHTDLRVREASQGEQIEPGTVYLAPAGYHLELASTRHLLLSSGPKRNHCRPSVDSLFESAARHCGPRALAVVLTGTGSDGAQGVRAVKRAGGKVLVQNRVGCEAFEMPGAAIATGCVDYVLPLEKIASTVTAFTMVPGAADLLAVPLPAWAEL